MHIMGRRAFNLKSITGRSLFFLRHFTLLRIFDQSATLGAIRVVAAGAQYRELRGHLKLNALEENSWDTRSKKKGYLCFWKLRDQAVELWTPTSLRAVLRRTGPVRSPPWASLPLRRLTTTTRCTLSPAKRTHHRGRWASQQRASKLKTNVVVLKQITTFVIYFH